MAYAAILQRIRLLIPAEFEGHYKAILRGFEEGDLTAPSLSISNMTLARAISEFTSYLQTKLRSRPSRGVLTHNTDIYAQRLVQVRLNATNDNVQLSKLRSIAWRRIIRLFSAFAFPNACLCDPDWTRARRAVLAPAQHTYPSMH
jgi:hypothetical protein